MVDSLLDRKDLASEEEDYLEVLGDLIELYESKPTRLPRFPTWKCSVTLSKPKASRKRHSLRRRESLVPRFPRFSRASVP